MQDLVRYLAEIVVPTVRDFEEHPTSVRHAFLACVATFHAVDYMAHPRSSRSLRQQWGRDSAAFFQVDRIAHAFKHVASQKGGNSLEARSIISRPPAVAGLMESGLSLCGDAVGAVTLTEDITVNVLELVRQAVAFLHATTR